MRSPPSCTGALIHLVYFIKPPTAHSVHHLPTYLTCPLFVELLPYMLVSHQHPTTFTNKIFPPLILLSRQFNKTRLTLSIYKHKGQLTLSRHVQILLNSHTPALNRPIPLSSFLNIQHTLHYLFHLYFISRQNTYTPLTYMPHVSDTCLTSQYQCS
jgi:hypothetical protein